MNANSRARAKRQPPARPKKKRPAKNQTGSGPVQESPVGASQTPGSFQEPPAGASQILTADAPEEEASQELEPPPEGSETTEAAAMAQAADAMMGISAELLQVKSAIEEKLRQDMIQSASAARVRSFESLQGSGNIQGVAIGLGGAPNPAATSAGPGSPALTVYVAEPASVDEVKSALVDSMGIQAASSDNVPINVVVTGLIDAQPHRWRERPVPAGMSVAHYKLEAYCGTIACLCTGRTAPRNQRLMVLSNRHVLAPSNNAVFGDCIVNPCRGTCPQDQIALLERFVPINFSGSTNYVDAGTAWAWPDRVRRELVYVSGGTQHYFRISNIPVAPALGMIVGKSGKTTQLTVGRITGIGVSIRVNYSGGQVALFVDQIAIHPYSSGGKFSEAGDSGSSIWTWNATRNPVGLLFGGGGGVTFANRMTRVLDALDIALYT